MNRLSGQSDESQMTFLQRWMISHSTDSQTRLKKPLVFAEFGKSKKEPGYTQDSRDSFLNRIYADIYNIARSGGAMGGGLVWQIMAEGMESYYDGYEIVLSQSPSTRNLIAGHSRQMAALSHM